MLYCSYGEFRKHCELPLVGWVADYHTRSNCFQDVIIYDYIRRHVLILLLSHQSEAFASTFSKQILIITYCPSDWSKLSDKCPFHVHRKNCFSEHMCVWGSPLLPLVKRVCLLWNFWKIIMQNSLIFPKMKWLFLVGQLVVKFVKFLESVAHRVYGSIQTLD